MNSFFNPAEEIIITRGNLPHWVQKDVFFSITFRLADSLPRGKIEELMSDRAFWNKQHRDKSKITTDEWKEYNRLFNDRVEEWLNNGYGSCLLQKKNNAAIVADALEYFHAQRYLLDEWVVMPNHVHVLVKTIKGYRIDKILHSWKSFTAIEINKKEGRTGILWMHESYDHNR